MAPPLTSGAYISSISAFSCEKHNVFHSTSRPEHPASAAESSMHTQFLDGRTAHGMYAPMYLKSIPWPNYALTV